jgi:predicted amidophosphoribosyltransferase
MNIYCSCCGKQTDSSHNKFCRGCGKESGLEYCEDCIREWKEMSEAYRRGAEFALQQGQRGRLEEK